MSSPRDRQTARKSTGGVAPRLLLARKLAGDEDPIELHSDEDDLGSGSSDGEGDAEFAVPAVPDASSNGAVKAGAKRTSSGEGNGTVNGIAEPKKAKQAEVVVDLSSDEEELEDLDDEDDDDDLDDEEDDGLGEDGGEEDDLEGEEDEGE